MRDRATLYLAQLGGSAGGATAITQQPDVSLVGLEKQLAEYLANGSTDRPFDMVRALRVCARVQGERCEGCFCVFAFVYVCVCTCACWRNSCLNTWPMEARTGQHMWLCVCVCVSYERVYPWLAWRSSWLKAWQH